MVDIFNYHRRVTQTVNVGNTPMGSDYPIRIQSMANVSTMDTLGAFEQAVSMIKAGSEYVRFTAQGEREAHNLGVIREKLSSAGYNTPLVADIHFNPRAADVAATVIEKVRINPGNYIDRIKTFDKLEYTDEEYAAELLKMRNRLVSFLDICKEHHTAIRIGVNHGSLSDRIMSRLGDTPQGMVEACMEFLRVCKEVDFKDVVISIKASNTVVMVQTVRLLVDTMEKEEMAYPLHIGVTEAGEGEDGRIKSAVGIGALLAEGIGDTIRVSLSEAPEAELPVARRLVDYIEERANAPKIEGHLAVGYNPIFPERRKSNLGSLLKAIDMPNVSSLVISSALTDSSLASDFIYVKDIIEDESVRQIIDIENYVSQENVFPCYDIDSYLQLETLDVPLRFVRLDAEQLLEINEIGSDFSEKAIKKSLSEDINAFLKKLVEDDNVIMLLGSQHPNYLGCMRAALHKLMNLKCKAPIVLCRNYSEETLEMLQIKASTDLGSLYLDGFQDGIMLQNEKLPTDEVNKCMFGILQATRVRISKTEYISCPSCGRTLYDIQTTIAKIKKATSHLKGLKIGIMGCIVNGPGEMADADYGYVGAGRNKISLYKGKQCVMKNIPEVEAVDRLVQLIKDNGDWQ